MYNFINFNVVLMKSLLIGYEKIFFKVIKYLVFFISIYFFFAQFANATEFYGKLNRISIADLNNDNKPPVAIINYSIDGNAVTLDARKSVDQDGAIVKIIWDFGDGTFSNEAIVSRNYDTVGPLSVTLTVVDDKGGVGITQSTYSRQNAEKVGFQEILQDGGGAVQAGTPVAVKVAALPTHDGQLKSISLGVKGKGVARPFRLALYTDINGKPGALVPGAITTEGSTVANAFEIVELPVEQGAPEIKSGQQYWIVIETTGTYLFFSSQWVSPGLVNYKGGVTSYNWPSWGGTVTGTYNSQMGAAYFTYSY